MNKMFVIEIILNLLVSLLVALQFFHYFNNLIKKRESMCSADAIAKAGLVKKMKRIVAIGSICVFFVFATIHRLGSLGYGVSIVVFSLIVLVAIYVYFGALLVKYDKQLVDGFDGPLGGGELSNKKKK